MSAQRISCSAEAAFWGKRLAPIWVEISNVSLSTIIGWEKIFLIPFIREERRSGFFRGTKRANSLFLVLKKKSSSVNKAKSNRIVWIRTCFPLKEPFPSLRVLKRSKLTIIRAKVSLESFFLMRCFKRNISVVRSEIWYGKLGYVSPFVM